MFKYICLSLAFTRIIFAQEVFEMRNSSLANLLVSFEPYNFEKELSDWNYYKIDECTLRDENVKNERQLRDIGLRRCRDGSVSFIQPNSEGWNGWEGKCGQTAAANTLFHFCRVAKDPNQYIDEYLSDLTPGVLPKTLRKGLSSIFSKFSFCANVEFRSKSFRTNDNFISFVKQKIIPNMSHPRMLTITRDGLQRLRQPVLVLVQNPGTKYLHWVTIIDQIDRNRTCNFIVNHWDAQYMVPCTDLANWSKNVGRTYPLILKSLSVVYPN